jgi:acetylornithine deacetylase/succinyl-diaminopimelate desuccinylase-like protein
MHTKKAFITKSETVFREVVLMTLTPDEIRLKATALLPGLLDDLERLVAYPSVAFPGFPQEPVLACAQETLSVVQCAGLPSARLINLDGGYPAIWVEAPAPPGRPTVLLFAHYDVQPAPLEQGWCILGCAAGADGHCYGRGAADDNPAS